MFHLVSGPFQPVLEAALVEEIQQYKSTDPFTSLAIIVPSEILRRRLQWLLCVEHGCALYDVHFLTFHQFALRLHDEPREPFASPDVSSFRLVTEFTLRQLLRVVLESLGTELQSASPLLNRSPGLCAALWATIRDLKDAMVPPNVMTHAINEGLFDPGSRDALQTLCLLYDVIQETTQRLQIGGPDDLTSLVIPHVPSSSFLARLTRVCYYGFYDLTQIQLTFFESVTRSADVTVYFPCVDDPAFAFARRFYDRHLLSGVVSETSPYSTFPPPPVSMNQRTVNVVSAVGAEDELTLACKEIMDLVELHGYRFEDIGLVARTLEPYEPMLSRLFEQHRIPFTSSSARSIIHEPAMKLLVFLARVSVNQFSASDMIDVLRSPYYRAGTEEAAMPAMWSEGWDEVVHTLGITRGEEQWSKLSTVAATDPRHIRDSVQGKSRTMSPQDFCATAQELHRLVKDLIDDCQALPSQGRTGELTKAYKKLIEKHLVLRSRDDAKLQGHVTLHGSFLVDVIHTIFEQLEQLDRFQETMTWEEWTNVFLLIVQESSLPLAPGPYRGVRVLDAMAARGLPFRAVIILSLNEKVFPRYIREDAFLRDGHRNVLFETLGYKIDEKYAGYDEERLLFALVHMAARDRLYLSYQRADEEGRVLAPSSFLRELTRTETPNTRVSEWALPRRFSDRFDEHLFRDSLLTGEELGFKLLRQGSDPSVLLEHAGREPLVLQQGMLALSDMERPMSTPGLFDGMIGPDDGYWRHVMTRGLSPTSLETYAQCPFQYFASQLLRIDGIRRSQTEELPVSVIGLLYHDVLRDVYAQLIQDEWPDLQAFLPPIRERIALVVEKVFASHAATGFTGYWLLWQLLKDAITELVEVAVNASLQEFLQSGFRPFAVEMKAEGSVDMQDPRFSRLKIHGRLDRIDRHAMTETFRVVDYKLKVGSQQQSRDRDLLASGIRGHYLQPALYSLMSGLHVHTNTGESTQPFSPESVEFVYLAPHREPPVDRAVFERSSWKSRAGSQLHRTLSTLVQGIYQGEYFILPGEYCQHCSVSTACRRFHETTWIRAYRSSQAKQIRHIRKQEILRD
ncbi:PD-(D/E)XK nuclease family protein [Nitrospira sp. M1]